MKVRLGDMSLAPSAQVHSGDPKQASIRRANSAALTSIVAGSMMLDSKGSILSCSHTVARLYGVDADEVTDRPVKSLLPGVPLGPSTEGYNVAFVAFFSATGRIALWNLVTAAGVPVQVEASFNLLRVESRYLFRLRLCWVDSAPAPTRIKSPIQQRPRVFTTNGVRAGRRQTTDTVH